jgi:hypothetical protein
MMVMLVVVMVVVAMLVLVLAVVMVVVAMLVLVLAVVMVVLAVLVLVFRALGLFCFFRHGCSFLEISDAATRYRSGRTRYTISVEPYAVSVVRSDASHERSWSAPACATRSSRKGPEFPVNAELSTLSRPVLHRHSRYLATS